MPMPRYTEVAGGISSISSKTVAEKEIESIIPSLVCPICNQRIEGFHHLRNHLAGIHDTKKQMPYKKILKMISEQLPLVICIRCGQVVIDDSETLHRHLKFYHKLPADARVVPHKFFKAGKSERQQVNIAMKTKVDGPGNVSSSKHSPLNRPSEDPIFKDQAKEAASNTLTSKNDRRKELLDIWRVSCPCCPGVRSFKSMDNLKVHVELSHHPDDKEAVENTLQR